MLFFVVDVCSEGKRLSRNYYFTNYEVRRGVIMSMPRTEITMKRDGRQITVTNVGKLPAIGVYVESPDMHMNLSHRKIICGSIRESRKLSR